MPNNIILIGPTGVGKTEISRRLAKLANAPFIKVEASKFTEVGYVGRDVESIIRDLVDIAINMVREEKEREVQEKANDVAIEQLLNLMLPGRVDYSGDSSDGEEPPNATRTKLRQKLLKGELDDRVVEVEVPVENNNMMQIFPVGMEEMGMNLKDMFGNLMPKKHKKRKLKVPEALNVLIKQEAEKLVDMDDVVRESIQRVQSSGIVFLDEIDKIAGGSNKQGPDVSREGVQRDLLPVVEGTTVFTKHGMVKTDHILFIASGAFHVSKPSDLIPELQGRFPIRVELESLTTQDFYRILTEPQHALTRQYQALLQTEGIELSFSDDGIMEIAETASYVNTKSENIGARRLHTIMSTLLEELLFSATLQEERTVNVDEAFVKDRLSNIIEDEDLRRFIL